MKSKVHFACISDEEYQIILKVNIMTIKQKLFRHLIKLWLLYNKDRKEEFGSRFLRTLCLVLRGMCMQGYRGWHVL